ncbi:MAG: permease-like cell division protein FtsX [Dysgonamonadaceae bacterium]|jgi:cell division transport system permease protein|nr:permease-like cell division protein FtsX [Dysgonamonadaceae bacterium]
MTKKYRVNKAMFFNAKITSIVSITLVLVLLGLTILTLFLGNRLSDYVKENVSFSVILEHNVTDAQIAETRKRLDDMPFVKSSRFIGKEEAKELLIQDLGEDPEELLGFNPAPDCIEIFLKSEYANTDSLAKVSEIIKAETNIDDLLYQQEVIELINNNLSKITAILLILSVVLLFISFTLISNTIRLSIYAKRFLIHTMNLVGAVDAFIRKPFVKEHMIMGIIAGLLADGIILGILYYFGMEYADLRSILTVNDITLLFGTVIVLGIIITGTATVVSVNHYLKMDPDSLYYV